MIGLDSCFSSSFRTAKEMARQMAASYAVTAINILLNQPMEAKEEQMKTKLETLASSPKQSLTKFQ